MSNMVVRTNVLAMNSHRNLGMVGNNQNRASARLSSGFRINSAADDAAGLGISEKMRSQIRGLNQASRNSQDGISLIQTAEGAMSTINEMVTRIRELVVQASNDTNAHNVSTAATWSQSDRTRIQGEIDQLMLEIDSTVYRTQFNTRHLLDGSLSAVERGGGDEPQLPENALDVLSAAMAWTANGIDDFTLADGFEFINDATGMADLKAAFISSIETAFKAGSTQANTASGFAAVVTAALTNNFRDNAATPAVVNLTSSTPAITNMALLMSTTAMTGANATLHTYALEAAQKTVRDALNSTDISSIVKPSAITGTADAPAVADVNAIDGNIFGTGANSFTANTDLKLAEGFEFAEGKDAASLAADINSAVWAALNITNTANQNNAGVIAALNAATPGITTGAWTALSATNQNMNFILNNDIDAAVADTATSLTVATHGADYTRVRNALLSAVNGAIADNVVPIAAPDDADSDAARGLWFQVGANVNQGVVLNIADVGVFALSEVGDADASVREGYGFADLWSGGRNNGYVVATNTHPNWTGEAGRHVIDGATRDLTHGGEARGVLREKGEDIQKFITAIDFALSHVTAERSNLGAMQNRLEFTIQNLNVSSENLSAAESRIRDADMAAEMMRMTQANVLQQAATSMLAQANQAPQSVLQLLR